MTTPETPAPGGSRTHTGSALSAAAPEGGWRDGDWFVTDTGRQVRRDSVDEVWCWYESQAYGARWTDEGVTDYIKSGRAKLLFLADRPEPVTARDHHVPGAENFNALLDDVLANPEAREAFEKAQAELVTAEERLARVRAYVDDPGNWSGLDGRRTTLLALIDGKENDHV